MRINPNPTPDLLAALARVQQDEQSAMLELTTGRRVNKPSDDPTASAVLVQNQDQSEQTAQYLKSLTNLRGQLQTADATLNSMVVALQRAITLGVEGATGTLSNANRASLADELSGIQDQLLSLANLSFQGQFLFAGTATRTRPFIADDASPSGVRYDGNSGVNAVEVGDGFLLPINKPGSQLFAAAGKNVFQATHDLIQAMQTGVGIDAAVTQVRQTLDYLSGQRVFFGNTVNQMDAQQTFLNSQKLELSQQETNLAGSDMASAVSRMVNAQNARDASLAAMGRATQTTLFDYLK